jgi:predicted nuclease with RNAse H fold
LGTKVAGLDLAALERNCSGYALIDLESSRLVKLKCLYGDEDIVANILADNVKVTSIDSPLAKEPKLRSVDRLAISSGFRVLPPNLGYMSRLTVRGWNIYKRLTSAGVTVIETHPRSALKSSRANSVDDLTRKLGIDVGVYGSQKLRKDLQDAIVAAIVSLCYVRRDCLSHIAAEDGVIYLIKPIK